MREGRTWLEEYSKKNALNPDAIPCDSPQYGKETVIQIKNAWFRYSKELSDVMKDFCMCVKKGELLAFFVNDIKQVMKGKNK